MPTTILDGETYEQARHRRFTEEAKVIEKIQQDEIIRMAREAGLIKYVQVEKTCVSNALERFAALFAAHEREACAKVCEPVEGSAYELGVYKTMQTLAAAIRARGEA